MVPEACLAVAEQSDPGAARLECGVPVGVRALDLAVEELHSFPRLTLPLPDSERACEDEQHQHAEQRLFDRFQHAHRVKAVRKMDPAQECEREHDHDQARPRETARTSGPVASR